MLNQFIQELRESFDVSLPERNSMSEYLDTIIPLIRASSEDINEIVNYSSEGGKPWMEVRDDVSFNSVVLHFFNKNGEYLRSTNGDIFKGKWRTLPDSNKIIIDAGASELFELAYLDRNFFILKKHGNHSHRKYFCMGSERLVRNIEWKDYVELLFSNYESNVSKFKITLTLVVLAIIGLILFTIL